MDTNLEEEILKEYNLMDFEYGGITKEEYFDKILSISEHYHIKINEIPTVENLDDNTLKELVDSSINKGLNFYDYLQYLPLDNEKYFNLMIESVDTIFKNSPEKIKNCFLDNESNERIQYILCSFDNNKKLYNKFLKYFSEKDFVFFFRMDDIEKTKDLCVYWMNNYNDNNGFYSYYNIEYEAYLADYDYMDYKENYITKTISKWDMVPKKYWEDRDFVLEIFKNSENIHSECFKDWLKDNPIALQDMLIAKKVLDGLDNISLKTILNCSEFIKDISYFKDDIIEKMSKYDIFKLTNLDAVRNLNTEEFNNFVSKLAYVDWDKDNSELQKDNSELQKDNSIQPEK